MKKQTKQERKSVTEIKSRQKCVVVILSLLLLAFRPDAVSADSIGSQQGKVVVELTGIKQNCGTVRIAVINSKGSFNERVEKNSYRIREVKVEDVMNISAAFDLPYGEYALKIYHDENDNNKLDKWPLIGLPREPYGFSNNARADFGPPSYEQARFTIKSEETVMSIMLR